MLSIFVFRVIVSESVGDGMHVACWWQRSAKLHELQSPKRQTSPGATASMFET